MADFRVAAVFSSHMVLQCEKNIAVFGEGEDGARVTVRLYVPKSTGKQRRIVSAANIEQQTTAYAGTGNGQQTAETGAAACVAVSATVMDGRWLLYLPPQSAGKGYEMEVSCGESKVRFTDVALGEVYLAGGQSNMELELQNALEGKEALQYDGALHDGAGPDVRFYYTQKIAYMDEAFFEKEKNTGWALFGEESARVWSAVGYFFARKLSQRLGVTVGLVGCNWGGTSASAWTDRETLTRDEELRSYVEEYEKAIAGKSIEEQIREYDEYEAYHDAWSKRAEELAKIDPTLPWDEVVARCGECKWPGPMCVKNPMRPSGLYACMLERVMPYTLRGVIWYQGESDDHKPRMYERLFTEMIGLWRRKWHDRTLPFLFVQLPMHRYQQDPDWKHWPLIREAQLHVYQKLKQTGMAVIPDCSEWNEIHPKRKQPVGERLADQALYQIYRQLAAEDAFGPMYREKIVHPADGSDNGKVELLFDYARDGFVIKAESAAGAPVCGKNAGDKEIGQDGSCGSICVQEDKQDTSCGFEVAGEDRRFVPADYEICQDRIWVSAKEVKEPQYVRYLWTNYRMPCIFGKRTQIPLAPFRTDEDDEVDVARGQ